MPTITGGRGSRRLIADSMTGVMITYSPVRNADVDGDVYCRPMVWVAYPPNRITPAMSPARTSMRRSGPRARSAGIVDRREQQRRDAEPTERGTRTA